MIILAQVFQRMTASSFPVGRISSAFSNKLHDNSCGIRQDCSHRLPLNPSIRTDEARKAIRPVPLEQHEAHPKRGHLP